MNLSNLGWFDLLPFSTYRLGIHKNKKRSHVAGNHQPAFSSSKKISFKTRLLVQFFVFLGLIAASGVALIGPVYFFPGTFAAQAANQTLATVNPQAVLPAVNDAGNFIDSLGAQTSQFIQNISQPTPLVTVPMAAEKTKTPSVQSVSNDTPVESSFSPDFVIETLASTINPLINSPREVLLPQTVSLDNNDAIVAGSDGIQPTEKIVEKPVPSPTQAPLRQKITQPAAPVSIPIPANLPAGDFIWPVKGYISQGYGRWHPGIDIVSPFDTPIYAAGNGVVQAANYNNYGLGRHIIIGHADGYTTVYAHLNVMLVNVGQSVAKGSLIGRIGLTGRTTGPHLHFEIRHNGSALFPLNLIH